ncbi:MAG: hypothetical protein SYC29_06535 [Planctomycetota bacterium]|nr:hypothetical protein [Planctomycetota bacterium]
MFGDMTTGTWVVLLLSILTGHAVLFVLGRYMNIVAVLAATFIMLAFLGFSTTRGDVTAIRLARIYCAVVALLLGLRAVHLPEVRAAGLMYFLFVILYVLSAMWSDIPVDALGRKTIYAMPMVLGLFLGYSIRDRRDLDASVRLLMLPGVVFACLFVVHVGGGAASGRLELLGTNANQAGGFSAGMAILCAYSALYGRSRIWRVVAYFTATILAMVILYTGSRGAAGYAIVGCFTVLIPMVRRPLGLIVLAVALLGTGWFLQGKIQTEATERMTELKLTGRDTLWFDGIAHVKESPLFGSGWVASGGSQTGVAESRNWHSLWIQTTVDTGAFGLTLLLLALITTSFYALRSLRSLGGDKELRPPLFLAGGLFGGALAHGFVESNVLIGSSLASLLLPFAIVLLERMPIILGLESPVTTDELLTDYDEQMWDDSAEGYGYEEDGDASAPVGGYPQGAS